jgi:hypothetical protein
MQYNIVSTPVCLPLYSDRTTGSTAGELEFNPRRGAKNFLHRIQMEIF